MTSPDPRMRIADSDRERAMADLAGHYAEGRLDHEEYDERLDAIWTARTRADLALLFSDLPRLPAPLPPGPEPAGPRRPRARQRVPLLPVLAALVVLSLLTGAHLWLLVFPLMFMRSRHRGASCGPPRGQADYRRPKGSHG
ncbi:hypothetical protein GCM10009641_31570 [Mycobacterium cookii]|uniref:DUF1707 domain-containing protein n=1 Tax=Nocardioides furvisabuli TaxID=375542 RepID=A0ABP5JB28_9ACTN|nr:DUF1707 domain-containing protein [Nocardioides furvisabuli]